MRKAHTLSSIKGSTLPEYLLFVDTETNPTVTPEGKTYQDLRLGVAIFLRYRRDGKPNNKRVYRFTSREEFWNIVAANAHPKNVLHLISHNAVFDFTVLGHITHLTAMGYDCQFVYEGGMRFISKWRQGKTTIMILDNANWFAGKLERWGRELNLEKMEMPQGLEGNDKWFAYCERDTDILYHLFLWYADFLRGNDLGKWKYTIASSAMTAYRHRFMAHPIYIPDEESDSDIARESYHGGRTECFRVGEYTEGPYYKLDINSMYPSVMRGYEYPTCFEGRYTQVPVGKLKGTLKNHCVIANVTLDCSIPYFCHTVNDRNVYPIGRFTTVLTTEELKLAVNLGWIKRVHTAVVYRKRAIFRDYVDFFYREKLEAEQAGQTLRRAFAKLYLNSLYGKFGQRGYVDKEIGYDEECTVKVSHGYNVRTGQRFTLRQVGHKVLYSERGGEGYNAFCAIASHVTANARMALYDAILQCSRENVFYCDTDSIICNERGYQNLSSELDSTTLGKWKIEGIADRVTIVAPKHYQFGDKWTLKGVRKDADNLGDNTYRQDIWVGYNAILKSGGERYYTYSQEKHLNPQIVSGTVDTRGFVHPFRMRGASNG